MNNYLHKISFLLLVFTLVSFRWPVENGRLTSTFGESRADHFHDGIDLIAPDDKIFPIAGGELLYFWDKSFFPLDNEPGGGNFAVMQHDDGICSVYMHLLVGTISPGSEGGQLAMIGNSGHSYGKHLHLSLLKRKSRESINPLSVFSKYEDTEPPSINAFFIKVGEKYIQIRDNASIRLTRHYPLLVEIRDTVSGNERLGIYSLEAVFNGKQALSIKFDTIKFSEQGLTVADRVFLSVFDEKGYYVIDDLRHRQGENTLEITASDFNGNISRRVFTYSANLDMEQTLQ
ncbi:MAG: M23 family metallopeptidase [Leptospirales bacterium]|nr:M23 family metallopeptidase [Leptospirales bacterium]